MQSLAVSHCPLLRMLPLLSLATACASRPATPPQTPTKPVATKASTPKRAAPNQISPVVAKMLARERPVMPVRPFTAPGGAFSGEAEALGPAKMQQAKDYAYVAIPIGTTVPLECYVYNKGMDAAASMRNMLLLLSKKATLRDPVEVSAGLVRSTPYIRLTAPFLVQQGGEPALMALKMVAFSYPVGGLVCVHNEVGYAKTFDRITAALAASLKVKGWPTMRAFRHINVGIVHLGRRTVGFVKTIETENAGRVLSRETMSMLVPLKKGALLAMDYLSNAVAKAGVVMRSVRVSAINGQLNYNALLTRTKDGYQVSGHRGGRPLRHLIATKTPLYSDHEQNKRVQEHFRKNPHGTPPDAKPPTFATFLPSMDPSKFSQVSFEKTQALTKKGELAVKATLAGKTRARMILDAMARPLRMHLRMGPLDLEIRRQFVHPKP